MLLSPTGLARILGVSRQTITRWCKAGYMLGDAQQINSRWVIHWTDLLNTGLIATGRIPVPGGVNLPRMGRPRGAGNRKPYPKGVKRPRKPKLEGNGTGHHE